MAAQQPCCDEKKKAELKEMYKGQNMMPAPVQVFSGSSKKHSVEQERSINEYYVNLVLSGCGGSVELERLLDKDQKVLVTGVAGVGKSTLMQYIAHNWGCDKLWTEKFDYVYKVSFKTYLLDGCTSQITTAVNNLRQPEARLKAFIAYYLWLAALRQGNVKKEVRDYMEDIVLGDRTLLLVDGYDEVRHYEGNAEFSALSAVLMSQPYFILTTRPNTMRESIRNRFDAAVDNEGLDGKGIEKFITLHGEGGTGIKQFLNDNPDVKKVCSVPVNAAMVCLLHKELSCKGHVTVVDLYTNMLTILARRFYTKANNSEETPGKTEDDLYLISCGTFCNHSEMKVLRALALGILERDEGLIFEAGTPGQRTPHTIHGAIGFTGMKLSPSAVYGVGILKMETLGEDHQYSFIQLSFQEYLAAYELKERALCALRANKKVTEESERLARMRGKQEGDGGEREAGKDAG
eukprot:TRINITY_DN1074_c0_g1_i4.p1 TRINITY_DN1074_c0_g1~~TRINITY_DN1074_c0_g1_i4.p1  ORF type:complete len:474 (+),score=167.85 TRINITY_DN1074_c0_g1_i4:38-1423(+)